MKNEQKVLHYRDDYFYGGNDSIFYLTVTCGDSANYVGGVEQMKHFEAKEKHAHKLAQAHQHGMMQAYDAGKRAAEWFHRPAYDVKNVKKAPDGTFSAGGTEQITNVNHNTKNP